MPKTIRAKITLAMVLSVVGVAVAALGITVHTMSKIDESTSEEVMVQVACANASRLGEILGRVEVSVDNLSYFARSLLTTKEELFESEDYREAYLAEVQQGAESAVSSLEDVCTVYYRLTEDISGDAQGFFLTQTTAMGGLQMTELTDLSLYDETDIGHVGWYYIPKNAGTSVWVGPYLNENIGVDIMSYVTPIYSGGTFVGVVGVDVNTQTIYQELEGAEVYQSDAAVVFDNTGNLVYDKTQIASTESGDVAKEALYEATQSSLSTKECVVFSCGGEEYKLYAEELENEMIFSVVVSLNDINRDSRHGVFICIVFVGMLIIICTQLCYIYISRLLEPLDKVTRAAEQLSEGNLDIYLEDQGEDEIGKLNRAFLVMSRSLKAYIEHFHGLAFTDDLTGLNNKTAFTNACELLDTEIRMGRAEFTLIVMDVNNLKKINDSRGHENGDLLLKHVAFCMKRIFVDVPTYRIGGDEFCAILRYSDTDALIERLQSMVHEISKKDLEVLGQGYQVAAGSATYEPGRDRTFSDVFARADAAMYENKRMLKENK